jgi:hypothetical protein
VTESSHNLTGAKTILSVRALGNTYLCLTDDSNTDFYTVFSRECVSTTPPTVRCSVLSPRK